MNDLLAGTVDLFITTPPSAFGHIRAGTVNALAMASKRRHPMLPEVPTSAEAGMPGFELDAWFAAYAPAGTPRTIVERLNAELRVALASPDVRARIADEGGDPLPGTPEQQAADIDEEETKWSALVRKLGLRVE